MACYTYVFACHWEDHCKIGFSRDPLARIAQLHPRWFEHFDLKRGFLIEVERTREARDLELRLRRPLGGHRAPQPLTIRTRAGGHTEWVCGAAAALHAEAEALCRQGHVVHAPLAPWMRDALQARIACLYEWPCQRMAQIDAGCASPHVARTLRIALDAHAALGIPLRSCVPQRAVRWHRNAG